MQDEAAVALHEQTNGGKHTYDIAANYQQGDAPVSYPYVWNIWKFDWVQYNGSVSQPLARNVGEALGVGAIAPLRSDMNEPLPHAERFRSSVDIPGLMRIEHALQQGEVLSGVKSAALITSRRRSSMVAFSPKARRPDGGAGRCYPAPRDCPIRRSGKCL